MAEPGEVGDARASRGARGLHSVLDQQALEIGNSRAIRLVDDAGGVAAGRSPSPRAADSATKFALA